MPIFLGTAGWSIPRPLADRFAPDGTALERYASLFSAVEINSSFHRPHRIGTWERWRDSVPDGFRFSVKVPKEITHVRKLVDCDDPLDRFLEETSGLGSKLAVLLVQLPPKLAFDRSLVSGFFEGISRRTDVAVTCEPRHAGWFTDEADNLLEELGIARVAADPAICDSATRPGGWRGLGYWRLHGSPVIYRSSYQDRLENFAAPLLEASAQGRDAWCIFDNTASSAAAVDAVTLLDLMERRSVP